MWIISFLLGFFLGVIALALFVARSEAIEEMKNKMSSYQDIVQTEEYQKLIRKYKTLINNDDSVING